MILLVLAMMAQGSNDGLPPEKSDQSNQQLPRSGQSCREQIDNFFSVLQPGTSIIETEVFSLACNIISKGGLDDVSCLLTQIRSSFPDDENRENLIRIINHDVSSRGSNNGRSVDPDRVESHDGDGAAPAADGSSTAGNGNNPPPPPSTGAEQKNK